MRVFLVILELWIECRYLFTGLVGLLPLMLVWILFIERACNVEILVASEELCSLVHTGHTWRWIRIRSCYFGIRIDVSERIDQIPHQTRLKISDQVRYEDLLVPLI